ncbi:MAG TPA: carbamate kinase [Chloroflexota bacterium]|nr:carbamate kinase [Chloroflexota bacterium]
MERAALIAIGGNALIRSDQPGTIAEQFENARAIASQLATLLANGWRLVLTHGNGPQVGFIMLRSERASDDISVPRLTLDLCVADSQGGLGYILANSILSALRQHDLGERVVCVLTHTLVDTNDPAFHTPSKPIGPFFDAEQAKEHRQRFGWTMIEDSGRGYRRVVPSPQPVRIVEATAIRALLDAGLLVIAAGGGGIPVVESTDGQLRGVEAVIDKDRSSAALAAYLGIPRLIITTGVEQVAIHFGKPDQRWLDQITVTEARCYLAAGEFPAGSMGPKIEAALTFLERGGKEVIISSPSHLVDAATGRAGTRIVPDTETGCKGEVHA